MMSSSKLVVVCSHYACMRVETIALVRMHVEKNVSQVRGYKTCTYYTIDGNPYTYELRTWYILDFYKKLKNVNCEYNRLNG